MKKWFLIIIFLTSCSEKKLQLTPSRQISNLQKKDFSDLLNWQEDNHLEALLAFKESCKIQKITIDRALKNFLISENIKKICQQAEFVDSSQGAKKFFEENFQPHLVKDEQNNEYGLFTGYYEIELDGSREKNEEYKYPIYQLPNLPLDDERLKRENINLGSLENQDLELLYVNDKIRLFMLHVQGSGIIKLNESEKVRVKYAGKSQFPYNSIGKYLISIKAIPKSSISGESISNWLYSNPDLVDEILNKNQSYVFFKINHKKIKGAEGSHLTPKRSLAIDSSKIPFGLPIWLETELPNKTSFNRLMVTQDSGSAIKGYVRGDVFFGEGKLAEKLSQHMNSIGSYYIFLPK